MENQQPKKRGRPRTRPIVERVHCGRSGPRPHVWVCGPDEYKHSMYMPFLRSKAQANYRGEPWELSFDQFYELWKDEWPNRGRKPDDICMTRNDPDSAWDTSNTILITRSEHLKRQGGHRADQGLKYYKKGPPGRPLKQPKPVIKKRKTNG